MSLFRQINDDDDDAMEWVIGLYKMRLNSASLMDSVNVANRHCGINLVTLN